MVAHARLLHSAAMTAPDRTPTPSNQFSFSRLKAFAQCPLRYRYRYLEGMREAFQSIEAHLGKVVHDVLEWLYLGRANGGDPGPDQALQRFDEQWEKRWADGVAIVRVEDSPEVYSRRGREMVASFCRSVFAVDRSETLALEQRLNARLAPDVVFTGFADRVGRTAGGRLFVVDYKTSSREGDGSDFSEGLQAPLYASCVMDHHGGDSCLAGYHYLRLGTTRWQDVSRERGRQLRARFLTMAREAIVAQEFPARPGPLCAWCGFNRICPEAVVPDHLSGGQSG